MRHLIGCVDVHLLTRLGHRKHQGAPTWKRHVHINGTIYYSSETQDPSRRKRKCGDEYHEWLEEADLEDLPYDLERLVHSDNPYRRETIGSFMPYQEVCRPRDDSGSESVYASSSSVPTSCRIGFRSHYFTPGLLTYPRSLRYSRNNLSGSHQNRIPCIALIPTAIWRWPSSKPWPIALTV